MWKFENISTVMDYNVSLKYFIVVIILRNFEKGKKQSIDIVLLEFK